MEIPSWFKAEDYLKNKLATKAVSDAGITNLPSLMVAFEKAGFEGESGAYRHFQMYGDAEGISPNAYFNATQYLQAKAAAALGSASEYNVGLVASKIAELGMSAWDHYQKFGATEGDYGINPSNAFDQQTYLEAKAALAGSTVPAVKAAITKAGMTVLQHYMQFAGQTGEVSRSTNVAVPADKQVGGTTGQTFTLTTGPDNISGTTGNDTINGYINTTTATIGQTTFTAVDVINGGTGVDTMNLTVDGANAAGSLPAASISGIEKFFIRDVNTSGASNYDFSTLDGETEVWADRSTAAVTFDKLATGTVVGVKGNGVVANGNVTFDMATASNAVAIALDGVKNGAGAADTVLKTANGQATAATITTSGAASDLDQIELSKAGAHTVKDATIKADANLTIGVVDGTADLIGFDTGAAVTNTITVTGSAASLKLNDLADAVEVVDASAFKGGVTAVGSGTSSLTTFKGGEGADNVTVGKISATGTVALGAGDDVFKAAANIIKSTNSVDGGAGSDTFSLTAIDAANLAKFSNFEIANLDSLLAATYDLSLLAAKNTVTGLTIDTGTTAAATVDKVAAGVGLKIVGDADSSNLTIKVAGGDTGAADTFGVEFAVPTSATGAAQTPSLSVTLNEVETINLVSGGGADTTNGFTLLSAVNTLSTATNKVTQTVNVSGANQMTLNVAGSTDADVKVVVDGSTMTGKLLATGGATTTVMKGGSAADTLTVGAGKTELTGGAGKDTFVVDAAVGSTNITTITDAAAGDIISTLGVGATAGTKLGVATDLAGATDIATILGTLATAAAGVATDAAWAVVGTDVYLVVAAGVAGVADDNVVKLVGVASLADATIDATGGITLA